MLLRRYSNRMDWAMNTLHDNMDFDYSIIVPLFEYYVRERFDFEMAARVASKGLKGSPRKKLY